MARERLTPERRREMTRTALIEAAADVIARKGYYGASLEQIAEEAGFTRGAIYSNFGSKEDLMLALIEYFDDVILANLGQIREVVDPGGEPVSGALAAARVWADTDQRSSEFTALALELRLHALRHPDFRKRFVELKHAQGDKIERFISEEAVAAGRLRIPARDLAEISLAAVEGLLQLASIDEERRDYYEGLVEKLFVLLAEAAIE